MELSNVKKLTRRYYRMEFLGYGMYNQLARFNSRNPKLCARLKKIADDEYKHGRMFAKYYENNYGPISGRPVWIFLGRLAGIFFSMKSMKKNLKKFSDIEAEAVIKIDKAVSMQENQGNSFLKCLKAIYKDELDHSKLYSEFYR